MYMILILCVYIYFHIYVVLEGNTIALYKQNNFTLIVLKVNISH